MATELLAQLAVAPLSKQHYTLDHGLIKHKGKVWLGNNKRLQVKVMDAMHNSAVGGHSGFLVTYRRIKQHFEWPAMKSTVATYMKECSVCQQAKPDRARYPGFLQPLAIPDQVLQRRMVSRDGRMISQVQVAWSGMPQDLATWEDMEALKQRFPAAPAWGQAGFQGRGNVSRKKHPEKPVTATGKEETSGGKEDRQERVKRANPKVSGSEWV